MAMKMRYGVPATFFIAERPSTPIWLDDFSSEISYGMPSKEKHKFRERFFGAVAERRSWSGLKGILARDILDFLRIEACRIGSACVDTEGAFDVAFLLWREFPDGAVDEKSKKEFLAHWRTCWKMSAINRDDASVLGKAWARAMEGAAWSFQNGDRALARAVQMLRIMAADEEELNCSYLGDSLLRTIRR